MLLQRPTIARHCNCFPFAGRMSPGGGEKRGTAWGICCVPGRDLRCSWSSFRLIEDAHMVGWMRKRSGKTDEFGSWAPTSRARLVPPIQATALPPPITRIGIKPALFPAPRLSPCGSFPHIAYPTSSPYSVLARPSSTQWQVVQ